MRAKPLIALILAPFVVGSAPAFAQQSQQEQLEDVERQIEETRERERDLKAKAKAAEEENTRITKEMVTLSRQIQETEGKLLENEERLQTLTGEIAAKTEEILSQNQNVAYTLAALQRLSQRPPEYILMRPAKAVETVRSASLLTSALPEIEWKTNKLKDDLEGLADLREEANAEQAQLKLNLEDLSQQSKTLEALQREKRALYADFASGAEQERTRRQRLAREARDLKALIERLEAEASRVQQGAFPSPSIPEGSSFQGARGQMPFPVQGRISKRFGDPVEVGESQGINIRTLSGGRVIAPFDGRIIYAGEFRTYGQLLIIAHGDGYHTLLAGLERIDGLVGQWVLAGEPLGVMPQTRLASTQSDSNIPGPELYLEIRRNGTPINPLPWLKK